LVIEKGFRAADGAALKEDLTLDFRTVNSDLNNKVYMGLMVLMFVFMFGFMFMKTKRDQTKAKEETGKKEEKINPYALAKKKGISVEKARAEIERKKKKAEKKGAKEKTEDQPTERLVVLVNKKPNSTKDLGIFYHRKGPAIPKPGALQKPEPAQTPKSNKSRKKNKKRR
jgi:hypothetical protein